MNTYSKRITIILFLFLFAVQWLAAQEQFEKRFDLAIDQATLGDAIQQLMDTQTNLMLMGYFTVHPSRKETIVSLHLKNTTFDEAMGELLRNQDFFKDYIIQNVGTFNTLELLREKIQKSHRYFIRNKNKGKYYHVGDKLPNETYTVSNYPTDTIQLHEVDKKLTILDLWGVNCSSCIVAMPKLQKLQKQFQDDVQIIMVTDDAHAIVENKKKYDRTVRLNDLPSITGENALASYFDNKTLPLQVWIDEHGVITYITHRSIASEETIRDFIAGKRMDIPETRDTSIYDSGPFAAALQPIHQGGYDISSYFAPHSKKYHYFSLSETNLSDTLKSTRQQGIDIIGLYRIAYGMPGTYGSADNIRIIKGFTDPGRYDADLVTMDNYYDYELTIKKREITPDKFLKMMQQQLDAYFGLDSRMEKRMVPIYVLKKVGDIQKLKTTEDEWGSQRIDHQLDVQRMAFKNLVRQIQLRRNNLPPLIDETGIDPELLVDCIMNTDFDGDLEAVNASLKPYGLAVEVGEREEECIVLGDAI